MAVFNHKKAVQAVNFFAEKEGGTIDKLKAVKLVWLSDRLHLRKYARLITNDNYFAIKRGPIPSGTLDSINNNIGGERAEYRNTYIDLEEWDVSSKASVDQKIFSQSDINIMEKIFELYGHMTGEELSQISHDFPEWKKQETLLRSGVKRADVSIEDFFENIEMDVEYPSMNESDDLLSQSKEMYLGV